MDVATSGQQHGAAANRISHRVLAQRARLSPRKLASVTKRPRHSASVMRQRRGLAMLTTKRMSDEIFSIENTR